MFQLTSKSIDKESVLFLSHEERSKLKVWHNRTHVLRSLCWQSDSIIGLLDHDNTTWCMHNV